FRCRACRVSCCRPICCSWWSPRSSFASWRRSIRHARRLRSIQSRRSGPNSVMAFVEVSALNKSYEVGAQRLHVLRDLELTVAHGEMVAVVGASGVGKSTLLHVLGGLDRADQGQIRVADTDLRAMGDTDLVQFRNRHVGFVFQFHHLLPEFDAAENVEMPMRIARRPL